MSKHMYTAYPSETPSSCKDSYEPSSLAHPSCRFGASKNIRSRSSTPFRSASCLNEASDEAFPRFAPSIRILWIYRAKNALFLSIFLFSLWDPPGDVLWSRFTVRKPPSCYSSPRELDMQMLWAFRTRTGILPRSVTRMLGFVDRQGVWLRAIRHCIFYPPIMLLVMFAGSDCLCWEHSPFAYSFRLMRFQIPYVSQMNSLILFALPWNEVFKWKQLEVLF